MNYFQAEKAALEKLNHIRAYVDKLKAKLANLIIGKSKKVGVITKDLKQKCLKEVRGEKKDEFRCKFCLKVFAEGRQLGGHVSRAHKNAKDAYSDAGSQKSLSMRLRGRGPVRRVKQLRQKRRDERQSNRKNLDGISASENEDSIYLADE